MLAINGSLLLFGVIVALLSRNIPANYDESFYIGLSIYAVSGISVAMTVLAIVYPEPLPQFLIFTFGLLAAVAFSLTFLLWPKIYVVHFPDQLRSVMTRRIETSNEKAAILRERSAV